MSLCALSCDDLLGYNQLLAQQWQTWFAANGPALDLPCDIRDTGNVRLLVQHICAAELRYAQQIGGQPPTDYADLPSEKIDEIFSIHEKAAALYSSYFATRDQAWLDEVVEVKTRSAGAMRASRKTIVVHAMLHAARHWAQLATLVRHAGYPGIVSQDYIFYRMER
jgi:uncharacterized damage-inducible protein DinB